jgi:glucans biosynthesis protein
LLLTLALLSIAPSLYARLESAEVNLDYIAKKAEERARKPFHSPKADLPDVLKQDQLDYDRYREIRFRHERALWASEKLPFNVEFFHPGYLYQEPVHLYEFTLVRLQPIRFVGDFFDYGKVQFARQIPADTGYAGFKILCSLNSKDKMDELGAFLGASYFRLLGKGQSYGLSARGLALDSGEEDRPEEFPIFTDWWLGKPHPEDSDLRFYAILDSPSCAGAFSFVVRPGETTTMDVDAVLYFRTDDKVQSVLPGRKPLKTMGVAPLTSMFWFGENSERKFDDYRPEVHDSDGLLMKMDNGEVLWRPLNNAPVMRHQRFATKNIRGFGLLQRDRDFSNYQDIFRHYHTVPSVWVEPHGDWGDGEINLVELSTTYEGLDNIVAFWSPKELPKPMEPYRLSYSLYWTRETDRSLSDNKVLSTRIGADARDRNKREIAVDFGGSKLASISENDPPTAIASCSENGTITEVQVFRVPFNANWRVILKLEPKPDNKAPIDIRCTLKKGEEVLSETWTYHWSPP